MQKSGRGEIYLEKGKMIYKNVHNHLTYLAYVNTQNK